MKPGVQARSACRARRRSSTRPRPRGSTAIFNDAGFEWHESACGFCGTSATTASPTCASSARPTATSRAARDRRRARTSRARRPWRPRRSRARIADARKRLGQRRWKRFRNVTGIAAPMMRINIDTDQIIPTLFLGGTDAKGYGKHLFHHQRYLADGEPNPEFILNQPPYDARRGPARRPQLRLRLVARARAQGAARVRLPRRRSRRRFGGIFFNNCYRNGIVPVELPIEHVRGDRRRRSRPRSGRRATVTVDLEHADRDGARRQGLPLHRARRAAADAARGRRRDRRSRWRAAARSARFGTPTGASGLGLITPADRHSPPPILS